MELFIVEDKDGEPMLHTLSRGENIAKDRAVSGSGTWKWEKFEKAGYVVVPVNLKRL